MMNDDLISRQAAIHLLEEMKELDYELWIRTNGYSHLSEEQWDWLIDNFKELNEVPSAQPEQKTGRWIDYCGDLHCSVCGFRNSDHYCIGEGIACPNCGVFMPDGLKNVLG